MDLIGIFWKFTEASATSFFCFSLLGKIPIFLSSFPTFFVPRAPFGHHDIPQVLGFKENLWIHPGTYPRNLPQPKRERLGLEILVDIDGYSNEKQGKCKKEGRGAVGMLMVMDMIPFGNGKAMDGQRMG